MHLPESTAGKRRGEKGIGKEIEYRISSVECGISDFNFDFDFHNDN